MDEITFDIALLRLKTELEELYKKNIINALIVLPMGIWFYKQILKEKERLGSDSNV